MLWNDRYNNQKFANPNLILHGIEQLGNGGIDILKGIGHGVVHQVNNMIDPFGGGGGAPQRTEKAYETMLNTPGAWDNPPGNGFKLYDNMKNHEYDGVPQAVDAALGYTGVGLAAWKGYNTVKSRLQKIKDDLARRNNPELMARKNEWNTFHPFAQALAIDVYGHTVDPHHPEHDITNDFMGTFPISTRPTRRQSSANSAIEVLSARLGALGCLSCGRPNGKAVDSKGNAVDKCPEKDGQDCKNVVMQKKRNDAANASQTSIVDNN